ncbi:MAG: sterol desaturase family protein [Betaproteobacteria bacterium]|nr:sterol desaturase family protein [Betaproteobacteria bacterium]
MSLADSPVNAFILTQAWVFEHLVEPALHATGWMEYQEQAFDATEFALLGLVEIALLVILFRPMEALLPAEHWPSRRPVLIDVLYTLLHRVGFIPLVLFVLMWPLTFGLEAWLRLHGYIPYTLEDLFPSLNSRPLTTFLIYLVVLDFSGYWFHRFQHRLEWWWALHGLHHSQRAMSFWTDDRTHFLDDILGAAWLALISLLIGVPPAQFILLLMITRILQSFAHANVAIRFGRLGERLLVSPHYHRVHHGMGTGSQSGDQSCNFAVLFPVWDIIFGTANFMRATPPTGILDQLDGRDYGTGLVRQQILGFQRLLRALRGLRA